MAGLVVDASVALAGALPDESSAYADAALSVVEQTGLHVPELSMRKAAEKSGVTIFQPFARPHG